MKTIKLFVAFLLLSNIINAQSVTDLFSTNFTSFTVPIDYNGQISYLNTNDVIETKNVGDVKHDKTFLPSLPNLVSTVTLYQVDEDGSLSLQGNTLSAKNSTYVVIYDYTQTQTIQINDEANKLNYYALIGISVRMVAHITTKSRGINLASLFGLSIAANKKKVVGSLEVRANGINSQEINGLIPVTADLSQSSIANALQSVATIKSHIYDADTKITPQFLAFSVIGSGKKDATFNFKQLSDKVKSFQLK